MKPLYEIFILDDNKTSIDTLCTSLKENRSFTVTGSELSPVIAEKSILKIRPDLIFLDVEMEEMTGFDFLQRIRVSVNWPMQVVFYTAYQKYLLQALRASAFDFLLKPYTEKELNEILTRYINCPVQNQLWCNKLDLLSNLLKPAKTFMIPVSRGHRIIKVEQICYFEYEKENRCWSIFLADGLSIRLKREIKAEYILRQTQTCLRISQKHIINPDYLYKLEDNICYLALPDDHLKEFAISRDCYKSFKDRFEVI
jgi:two-component system, LytTR family, response regulator